MNKTFGPERKKLLKATGLEQDEGGAFTIDNLRLYQKNWKILKFENVMGEMLRFKLIITGFIKLTFKLC
ncbi:MAG: hypothetical protein WC886_08025 [Saccharofermentanaceae bacterium]